MQRPAITHFLPQQGLALPNRSQTLPGNCSYFVPGGRRRGSTKNASLLPIARSATNAPQIARSGSPRDRRSLNCILERLCPIASHAEPDAGPSDPRSTVRDQLQGAFQENGTRPWRRLAGSERRQTDRANRGLCVTRRIRRDMQTDGCEVLASGTRRPQGFWRTNADNHRARLSLR